MQKLLTALIAITSSLVRQTRQKCRRQPCTPNATPCHRPSSSSFSLLLGPNPVAPAAPRRSRSARRNQQGTNRFPDPDLAPCPGAGVPEPAQNRSQDHEAGKGGGGEGGWDQPRGGSHQRRLPGSLVPTRCKRALIQNHLDKASAQT